jgi:hypothetical protein
MVGIPIHPDWSGEDPRALSAGIARAVRAASRDVYPGWTEPQGDGDPGEIAERAIEAQIAAAVLGRKPLYFEPWGDEVSRRFRSAYRRILPDEVKVSARDGMLFVFRPEIVKPILDADPAFYLHRRESDLACIARVSESGENGELLGYGARHIAVRPAYHVRIYRGESLLLYFFVSSPDENAAARIAYERTADFYLAHGWSDVRFVMEFIP